MLLDILKFLNENAGAVGVIFSGLVTLATLVYAALTWKLVSETRRMRKAQTDAKVTVRVEPRKEAINFLYFIVANEGIGPAYDIKFALQPVPSKEINESILDKIKSLGFISQGLEYLSPNQEIRTFLTSMLENFEKKIETAINLKVSYKNSSGEKTEDMYLIDMSIFKGLNQVGKPDLYSIAKDIEKIQKDFHNISTGFTKLKVITQTKSDFIREEQQQLEEANKFFEKQKRNEEPKKNGT
jgi:hypothetical protein